MRIAKRNLSFCAVLGFSVMALSHAHAEKIPNDIAVFTALDKVTAQISPLEVPIDQTASFGNLNITARACYTRPPTETPVTSAFIEVDEKQLDDSVKRIFTGWVFAQSPGLHAIEHPIFDVWLTNCKTNEPAAPAGNPWKVE